MTWRRCRPTSVAVAVFVRLPPYGADPSSYATMLQPAIAVDRRAQVGGIIRRDTRDTSLDDGVRDEPDPPVSVAVPPGSFRYVRKTGHQKLLGSLRGAGALRAAGISLDVAYELDRFEDKLGQRASGSVNGNVSAFADLPEGAIATLVLENGDELPVLVSNAAEDGADVEVKGSPSTGEGS